MHLIVDGSGDYDATGLGEFFIRSAVAYQVSARMRYGDQMLESAAIAALDEVRALGGDGGLIAIDRQGNIAMPFNSEGMKRAAVYPDGRIVAEAGVDPAVLVATCDPRVIEDTRRNWPFLRDRRIDAYGPILNRYLG